MTPCSPEVRGDGFMPLGQGNQLCGEAYFSLRHKPFTHLSLVNAAITLNRDLDRLASMHVPSSAMGAALAARPE